MSELSENKSSAWRRILAYPEIGLAMIMLLMFIGTALNSRTIPIDVNGVEVQQNVFTQPDNLHQILREGSYFVIMAVGATLVLVCGGVDLSIGSIYCLSAVVGAYLMSEAPFKGRELPAESIRILLGAAAALTCGAVCGTLNGVLITILKTPPFLVTLGTMLIFRCFAFLITGGRAVAGLPESYLSLGQYQLPGGFNIHVLFMLLIVALGWVFLTYSVPGRMALAVGGNEEAARTAGIPVQRVKIAVYAIAGTLGGLAGLLYIAHRGAITSNDGTGFELIVIAATVIGGASITGGRGSAIGAMLGAMFLQQINNAIVILQSNQNYEKLVVGIVIIAAAGIDRLRERVLGK